MLYTVTVEYKLFGVPVQETIECLDADSEQDASDAAYDKVLRQEPSAKNIEVLSVTKAPIGV